MVSVRCGGCDEALRRGVGRGAFLEDFAPESPATDKAERHGDTRSRPLSRRSSGDLTWEALTALDPGGTGEAQAWESG